ncbi:MAG TPA: PAS domain-containing sensor histidine kinase [Hanamia sp.]|nr:PAS domain-containing sensor histidine kinase [Hanamia sp.]
MKDHTEALRKLRISNHQLDQLEEMQAYQKAILDNAGAMIIATDEKGLITFFNHEASLNTGYDEMEVINKKTPLLFHDKKEIAKIRYELLNELEILIEDDFAVLVEKARRSKHEEEEFTYIRKDKTSFPVSLNITAVKNNSRKIIGFMSVAFDITERRKAEDELRNVQQLFLQLLKNYPDGSISIIDNKLRFVYTGGQLQTRLNIDQKELIGADIYPNIEEPLRNIIIKKLGNVFLTRNTISNFELPHPVAGDTYMMDAFPLLEEDGSVNKIGVIIRNISGLKKTEEGLRDALEKEKELGELKSRFVSMASHEFRTPLSTILSSAYLIEKYTTSEDQPKREKHLQRIISSVSMLTDILNDFLSLGKIEEGKIEVKLSEFNVKEMVSDTIKEMEHSLKKDQTINYSHEGSPEVFLDVSLLKFILMNLVSNAVKFSSEGASINIKTIHKDQHILLSVKDQGIGISKQDQAHLMERFFRGANATNIQGTGLGLHIVDKYAELMNGSVECKSELEEGTEFIITFDSKDS